MARHYLTVSNKVVPPISRRRGSTRINDVEPVVGAWVYRGQPIARRYLVSVVRDKIGNPRIIVIIPDARGSCIGKMMDRRLAICSAFDCRAGNNCFPPPSANHFEENVSVMVLGGYVDSLHVCWDAVLVSCVDYRNGWKVFVARWTMLIGLVDWKLRWLADRGFYEGNQICERHY